MVIAQRNLSKLSLIVGLAASMAACPPPSGTIRTSGSMAGSFGVSDSGAATYTIPLRLPPGIGDAVPSLSLVYSSQAGDGLMGIGWQLAGLSTITRCMRTEALDGEPRGIEYSEDDAYCLDGQRLVDIGGREYRTATESFTKIVRSLQGAGSGPRSFTLTTPDGIQHEYGVTDDSRIEAAGVADGSIRVYALNKVTDLSGNYYTVTYGEDSAAGAFWPERIEYSLNDAGQPAQRMVEFAYDERVVYDAALVRRQLGKAHTSTTRQLTAIQTKVLSEAGPWESVLDYRLTYEPQLTDRNRTRLEKIEECSNNACKAATTFDWADGTAGVDGIEDPSSPTGYATDPTNYITPLFTQNFTGYDRLLGDFDGDGVTDLYMVTDQQHPNGGDQYFCSGRSMVKDKTCVMTRPNRNWKADWDMHPGDFDGDGTSEFLSIRPSDLNTQVCEVATSQANVECIANDAQTPPGWHSNHEVNLGDYDGDGRTDVLFVGAGSRKFCPAKGLFDGTDCHAPHNTEWAAGDELFAGDYTGDGRTDLWTVANGQATFCDARVLSGSSTETCTTYTTSGNWRDDYDVHPGDYNGDGQTDLYLVGDNEALFCAGPGIATADNCSATVSGQNLKDTYDFYTGDFNGDGAADVGLVDDSGINFCAGPFVSQSLDPNLNCIRVIDGQEGLRSPTVGVIPGDFDGDAVPDFLVLEPVPDYSCPSCPTVGVYQQPAQAWGGSLGSNEGTWIPHHIDMGRDAQTGHTGTVRIKLDLKGHFRFADPGFTPRTQVFTLTVEDWRSETEVRLRDSGGNILCTFSPTSINTCTTTSSTNYVVMETASSHWTRGIDLGNLSRTAYIHNPARQIVQFGSSASCTNRIAGSNSQLIDSGTLGSSGSSGFASGKRSITSVNFAAPNGDFLYQRIHLFINGDTYYGGELIVRIGGVDVFGSLSLNNLGLWSSWYDGNDVEILIDTDVPGNTIEIHNPEGRNAQLWINEVQREVFVRPDPITIDFDTKISIARGRSGPIDVIEGIHVGVDTQGNGTDTAIHYESMTNMGGDTYAKGTGSAYPVRDVQGPSWVARTVTFPDGTVSGGEPGTYDVWYWYEGLRADAERGQSLGFERIIAVDTRNNLLTEREFEQQPFLSGRLKREALYNDHGTPDLADNTLLSETLTTWALKDSDACGQCKHPVPEQVIENVFSLDGEPTTTTTTTFSDFDTYANAETIAASTDNWVGVNVVGEYTRTISTEYNHDTDLWLLRRPDSVQQSTTGPWDDAEGETLPVRLTSFQYDARGRLQSAATLVNGSTLIQAVSVDERDARGLVKQTTATADNAPPRTTSTTYDSYGFPDKLYNAKNHMTDVDYQPDFGLVARSQDPNGVVSRFVFDNFGRTSAQNQDGAAPVAINYKDCRAGCPFANAVLKTTVQVEGAFPVFTYLDALGRPVGQEGTIMADVGGTLSPRTVQTYTRYDLLGRVQAEARPYFIGETAHETVTTYDLRNRPTTVTTPGDRTTRIDYLRLGSENSEAIRTTTPDPGNGARVTTRHLDSLGNVTKVQDAETRIATYSYDGFSQLRELHKDSVVIEMDYDAAGRRVSLTDPSLGARTFVLDGFGQLLRTESASSGRLIVNNYDSLGRIETRADSGPDFPTENWTWQYDTAANGKGKLDRVHNDKTGLERYERSHTYDSFSRPQSTTVSSWSRTGTKSVGYDSLGRLASETYPSLAVGYTYADDGSIEAMLSNGATLWQLVNRDALGRVTAASLANGLTTATTYDPATSDLQSIVTGDGLVQSLDYEFDAIGNLESRHDTRKFAGTGNDRDVYESFSYDHLDRLVASQLAQGPALHNRYDSAGNITCMRSLDPNDCQGGHGVKLFYEGTGNAGPHSVTGVSHVPEEGALNVNGEAGPFAATYAYDTNGNQTEKRRPDDTLERKISYYAFDKPAVIQDEAGYLYGPERDMVFRYHTSDGSSTFMPFSGYDLWTVFDAGTSVDVEEHRVALTAPDGTSLIYTTSLENASFDLSSFKYAHSDHLGSSSVVTDSLGEVVEERAFDAFGRHRNPDTGELVDRSNPAEFSPVSSRATDRAFTGQREEAGHNLYNYGARFYDPTIGRFLQPDPVIQAPYDSQNLNRYSYVLNNPLRYVDPTGNRFEESHRHTLKHVRKTSFIPWLRSIGGSVPTNNDATVSQFNTGIFADSRATNNTIHGDPGSYSRFIGVCGESPYCTVVHILYTDVEDRAAAARSTGVASSGEPTFLGGATDRHPGSRVNPRDLDRARNRAIAGLSEPSREDAHWPGNTYRTPPLELSGCFNGPACALREWDLYFNAVAEIAIGPVVIELGKAGVSWQSIDDQSEYGAPRPVNVEGPGIGLRSLENDDEAGWLDINIGAEVGVCKGPGGQCQGQGNIGGVPWADTQGNVSLEVGVGTKLLRTIIPRKP